MEMELAKCKIDIMSLNSQLLDAIQQKLNLSQQLEAWQVGQRASVVLKFNNLGPILKACFHYINMRRCVTNDSVTNFENILIHFLFAVICFNMTYSVNL